MSAPSISVADLRTRPDFASAVADRVWRAWWKPKGHALAPIGSFVQSTLADGLVPSALVAHDGPDYLGSALVIASDVEGRPDYTPWIAAVWVEARVRGRGIGTELIRAGRATVAAAGVDRAYICAMPHNHAFYLRLGWTIVEADVDGRGLAVFSSPTV